jgi:hypothetical protein
MTPYSVYLACPLWDEFAGIPYDGEWVDPMPEGMPIPREGEFFQLGPRDIPLSERYVEGKGWESLPVPHHAAGLYKVARVIWENVDWPEPYWHIRVELAAIDARWVPAEGKDLELLESYYAVKEP